MTEENSVYRAWHKLPITMKVLLILGSAFAAGGTTFAAASEFTDLPGRVSRLEETDSIQTVGLKYLVCRERLNDSPACDFILNDTEDLLP